jgi:hypothetical protein
MIQTEYPMPRASFTADQLCAAYDEQAKRGWDGDLGRAAAAMALVGHQAPCELVDHVAGMIRQALEERG